jgi:hypothetical protein
MRKRWLATADGVSVMSLRQSREPAWLADAGGEAGDLHQPDLDPAMFLQG